MFDIQCEGCGKRRLLPASRVRGLHNDARGIVVFYECYCGQPGALLTGRAAERRQAVAA